MNTTRIYEPEEQDDHHFQMATWYGDSDTPTAPVHDRLQVWADRYMLSISAPDGGDTMMIMKENLQGLKHMLDEYENWLEENDY